MKWAQQFLRLFISHSPSSLQLPKLHCWLHHNEQAIRLYGALDGYSLSLPLSLSPSLSLSLPLSLTNACYGMYNNNLSLFA